jgi:hypothetical protein
VGALASRLDRADEARDHAFRDESWGRSHGGRQVSWSRPAVVLCMVPIVQGNRPCQKISDKAETRMKSCETKISLTLVGRRQSLAALMMDTPLSRMVTVHLVIVVYNFWSDLETTLPRTDKNRTKTSFTLQMCVGFYALENPGYTLCVRSTLISNISSGPQEPMHEPRW